MSGPVTWSVAKLVREHCIQEVEENLRQRGTERERERYVVERRDTSSASNDSNLHTAGSL